MAKCPDVLYTRICSFISSSENTEVNFFKAKYLSIRSPNIFVESYELRLSFWGESQLRGYEILRETTGSHRGLCGEEETVEDHRRTVLQAVRLGARATVLPKYLCSQKTCYMPQKSVELFIITYRFRC
jgi:hypothetical protein